MTPEEVRKIIQEELSSFIGGNGFTFQRSIQILDARNIQLGEATGTRIGMNTKQKVAFYGVTPVIQASAITAPAGGGLATDDAIDQSARTKINEIRTAIKNFGITA